MKTTTITEQLRNLGYTPKQIKTLHNHLFRICGFKSVTNVEIHGDELWFINYETGEITSTTADFYRQF